MPGSATELNGEVPPTLLFQVRRLFGNRGPQTEGQDARAGDQRKVPENMAIGLRGYGSSNALTQLNHAFQSSLAESNLILPYSKMIRSLAL